jgi:hypothetical protein
VRDDRGLALDVADCNGSAGGAECGVCIKITEVDAAAKRDQIEIHRVRNDDLPVDSAADLSGDIAAELSPIFRAGDFFYRDFLTHDFHVGSSAAAGVYLNVADRRSNHNGGAVSNGASCQSRKLEAYDQSSDTNTRCNGTRYKFHLLFPTNCRTFIRT